MIGLDMYWKRNRAWWHYQQNMFPVINDDAPKEAKQSYKNYLQQLRAYGDHL